MAKVSKDPAYQEANAKVGMQVQFLSGEEMSKEWEKQEGIVKKVVEGLQ